jgi:hypothetical protein
MSSQRWTVDNIPTTKEEAALLIGQGDLAKLSRAQQKAIQRFYPRATLPGIDVEEEIPIPQPVTTSGLAESLQRVAYSNWTKAETREELAALLQENFKEATPDQVQKAITTAEELRARERELTYEVIVSQWEDQGGSQVTTSYQNDPKIGIFLKTRTVKPAAATREKVEHITAYYLHEVIKHINPLDRSEVTYSLTLQHPKNPRLKIPYEETPLSEITQDLAHNQPGVRDARGRVHAAISSLVDHQETEGRVPVKASIPATGFFEDNGKLYHSDSKLFRLTAPAYSKVRTKKALEVLEEIIRFYAKGDPAEPGSCDHALTALYFMVAGPLGAIRKAHGVENKVLLLTGAPHTGKTILEKINASIWSLPEAAAVIGSAKLTPAQLATHLSQTTYPIAFDETRNVLSNPGIADLLKSSTTGLLVKERILPKQGFRKQSFYAYSSVIMSTNFIPDLYVGLRERIIPVEFTIKNKKSEDEAKRFDRYLSENREELGYLGAALRQLFQRRWNQVRGLSLQQDQVKAGYEILYLLFQQEGIQPPAWYHEVKARFELEEEDPVRTICDFMREDFLRILRSHYKGVDIPQTWTARLDLLKSGNLLPPYIANISGRSITVNNGLLKEVAKRGHEIPGGLTGLAEYVNLCEEQTQKIRKVETYKGQKAIPILREVFYTYVAPMDYQEELHE